MGFIRHLSLRLYGVSEDSGQIQYVTAALSYLKISQLTGAAEKVAFGSLGNESY